MLRPVGRSSTFVLPTIVFALVLLSCSHRLPDCAQTSSLDCRNNAEGRDLFKYLHEELKVSFGLADLIAANDCEVRMRHYILDTSDSTKEDGGIKFDDEAGKPVQPCKSTRLGEIQDFALRSLKDASHDIAFYTTDLKVGALLDSVTPESHSQRASEVEQKIKKLTSSGSTPVTQIVSAIDKEYSENKWPDMMPEKTTFLVVSLDGSPDKDKDSTTLQEALENLQHTVPYDIVFRMTASDDSVTREFDELERTSSLDIEVISDLKREGAQVFDVGNNFFAYTPILHFLRSRGTTLALLKKMDNKVFTDEEARHFVIALLRQSEQTDDRIDALAKETDPKKFVELAEDLNNKAEDVYDGYFDNTVKPIRIDRLKEFLRVPK
eukprot:TRINITY_DN14165_c0_g1_i1.p1 TRINITY_DN14165_c0_g1~~TRINITY_DN14165_c0_g1_i1.p1  ORF type:complete len:380 (+),score=51.32 TRINITY_DN14165_c0_g1_i1:63-1202(+)